MSAPKKNNQDTEAPPEGEGGEAPIDEGGGGSSKKKLLIILVPVILLIGGGAGAYFTGMLDGLLGKKPAVEGEHGEAAEGEHGEAGPTTAFFVKIPDIVVNLSVPEGEKRAFLRMTIQLEVANELDGKALETIMPRVIDQFQTYLRELRPRDLRGSAGLYRVKLELLSRANRAAKPIEVKSILLQDFVVD